MRVACCVLRAALVNRSRPTRISSHRPLRAAVCVGTDEMRVVRQSIALTTAEKDLFEILRRTTEHYDLDVTLRCAGGWVRDKLLGKNSDDIDVAIDNMYGAAFAEKVNGYLLSQGEEVHPVAVIETNPDQSKHLETARIKIHGVQLDLVNLRSETYTQMSRVPQMDFGTPSEDAHRRDLTINSMFYNINESLIEDFTESGLEDLENGVIRTPLPPLQTFLDDPLRVLRAVRFAARFSFQMDAELLRVARSDRVQEALQQKVSRERIGTEVDGMFKGPNPVMAVQHLVDLSLFHVVFLLPENLHVRNYGPSCFESLKAAYQILMAKGIKVSEEEQRLYLLASMLVPIQMLKGPHATTKGTRHFSPATSHVVWEGLRWKTKNSKEVALLHEQVPKLIDLYNRINLRDAERATGNGLSELQRNVRVELGLWVREVKSLWRLGVLLAPLFSMKESIPSDIDPEDYPLHDFVMSFNEEFKDKEAETEAAREAKRLRLCNELEQMIVDHDVADAWRLKPLVDGKSLMLEMEMPSGGPILGRMLEAAIRWQLAFPDGSKEDCLRYLKDAHKTKRTTEQQKIIRS